MKKVIFCLCMVLILTSVGCGRVIPKYAADLAKVEKEALDVTRKFLACAISKEYMEMKNYITPRIIERFYGPSGDDVTLIKGYMEEPTPEKWEIAYTDFDTANYAEHGEYEVDFGAAHPDGLVDHFVMTLEQTEAGLRIVLY